MPNCNCRNVSKYVKNCQPHHPHQPHQQTNSLPAPYSYAINVYSQKEDCCNKHKKYKDGENHPIPVNTPKDCEPCEPLKKILDEQNGALKEEFQLYNAILFHLSQSYRDIIMLINNAQQSNNNYSQLVASMDQILNYYLPKVVRILITLPDGTVMYDSSKGNTNTRDNFLSKSINENHNTRVAIMIAQMNKCGIGYEEKYSSTTQNNEIYVAYRIGDQYHNTGTFRLSVKIDASSL